MPAAYGRLLRRRWLTLAVLALLVGALVLVSLTTGSSALTAGDLLEALLGRGTDQTRAILFRVRLPRTAAVVLVGAALALSGCVM